MAINRCFDCSRFVPVDVEARAEAKHGNREISGVVHLTLICADCGAPLGTHCVEFECRTSDFVKEV